MKTRFFNITPVKPMAWQRPRRPLMFAWSRSVLRLEGSNPFLLCATWRAPRFLSLRVSARQCLSSFMCPSPPGNNKHGSLPWGVGVPDQTGMAVFGGKNGKNWAEIAAAPPGEKHPSAAVGAAVRWILTNEYRGFVVVTVARKCAIFEREAHGFEYHTQD